MRLQEVFASIPGWGFTILFAFATGGFLLAAADGKDGRWWSHVSYLASDDLEGRNTGSAGHAKAVDYVVAQFEKIGLEPPGASGYRQTVGFRSRRVLEEQCSVTLVRGTTSEPLVLGDDATISMRVEPAEWLEAPLVFVGYGLTVPEAKHDDLAGLDMEGKVAVYLSGGPAGVPGPLLAHYQSTGERWSAFLRAGAVGTVSIQNPRHMEVPWERSTLARLSTQMSLEDPAMNETAGQRLSLTFNPARAEKLFSGSGHTLSELLKLADAGQPLPRFPLPAGVQSRVRFETSRVDSDNVAGVWRGTDPQLSNEYVVLSAHLDHLGVGQPIDGDAIHNGAMDNAAGVASLLEIASRLAESNTRFRRSVLFLAVTAEEKGLLGSRYFALKPTVDAGSMVANLNIDMFLPLFPMKILMALGRDESDLGDLLRVAARPMGVAIQSDPEPLRNRFIRSDQYNFIRRGVPSLAFKIGYEAGSREAAITAKWTKARYHAPSDDLDQPVDLKAADDFNKLMMALTGAIANSAQRPAWKANSFFRRFGAVR